MNRYILFVLLFSTSVSAIASLDTAYNQAQLLAQWTDNYPPGTLQAPSSIDPKDFTESYYGCHSFVYRTAENTYNLFFTTKKPVVITKIENQQKTREVTKYRHVHKARKVERIKQVKKPRNVQKFRTVTKTRYVWKTMQIPEVIYPVYKTHQVRKTRTVYAPLWHWFFGMGWRSWEEEYWVTETYTTFEIKYVDQRYRAEESYQDQEPYTVTEYYEVDEPYWDTEIYSEQQPFTVEETYTEPVGVKKLVATDCMRQPEVTQLLNAIKKDNTYRFVFDNDIGIVAKVAKLTAERTQGLLSYRILQLTSIDTISPPQAITRLPIDIGVGDKKHWHWYRLLSIHIKKLTLHSPSLSLSQGKNSLNLAWNSTKYTDNYDVEVAYNGNDWQTLATVNNNQYVFPYNSQWNIDTTQIRVKACRDNPNTCSQSNSQVLSTVVKKPIANDRYHLTLANTPMRVNLSQINGTKFSLTGFPDYGEAFIKEDNVLTYTPTMGYTGEDKLNFKITHPLFSEIHSNSSKIIIEVVDYKNAVTADKINGNTQATNAIKKTINQSATDWAELEDVKKQAERLANNALIEANHSLASAKLQALAILTENNSDAARINKIRGNTKATDTITNLINSATTIAEIEAKKIQAMNKLKTWDEPVAYEYDELSRLIKVVIPYRQLEVNYIYDAMGNRLTRYSQLLSE